MTLNHPRQCRRRPYLLFLLVAGMLGACAVTEVPTPPDYTGRWEIERFERTFGDCEAPRPDCVSVMLRYPVLSSGGPVLPVDAAVEGFVAEHLLSPVVSDIRVPDMETLAAQLVFEYEKIKTDLGRYSSRWYLHREVSFVHAEAAFVSLCFSESIYTGGAHPNTLRRYRTLDAKTGAPVTLDDLAAPAGLARLTAVAAEAFRRMHEIPPGVTLAEAGFWFENGRFRLNDNFALTGEGLMFYYNPYEIAAYARGPTELRVPFSEVNGVVDPRWWN